MSVDAARADQAESAAPTADSKRVVAGCTSRDQRARTEAVGAFCRPSPGRGRRLAFALVTLCLLALLPPGAHATAPDPTAGASAIPAADPPETILEPQAAPTAAAAETTATLAAVEGTATATASPRTDDAALNASPEQWSQILASQSDRFAQSRLRSRQAQALLAEDNPERAMRLLQEAIALDPLYPTPHFLMAKLLATRRNAGAALKFADGVSALASGYRNQSIAAANALAVVDMVLLVVLCWTLAVLLMRYLPFVHHQLSARLAPAVHVHSRAWLLWVVILAPFAFGWGLLPTLALALVLVWLYAGWRPRLTLGLLMLWFAAQGIHPAPFGVALNGIDPLSSSALVMRAAEEPPTVGLRRDLVEAVEREPQNADLLFALGLLDARAGRFAESSTSFQAGLALDPDDAVATTNLANNHFFLGDIERAVAGYQRAAALDSTQALAYYNLSQAYIKKLFFKEAGVAMRAASTHGYGVQQQPGTFPRGAVHYVQPSPRALWALAWQDRTRVAPPDLLGTLVPVLGVPPDHAGWWLAGSLLLCLVLSRALRREQLVFECANCASLACRRCSGHHEGSVLCAGCAATARRAKSELVLSTLLRNRRNEAQTVFQRRARRLNAWLLGAGGLYNSVSTRTISYSVWLAILVVGALLPGLPLSDPWEPGAPRTASWVRIGCAALLALMALLSRFGRPSWRNRQFHLHPASLVRLVDLIDGRPARKIKT